MQPASSMQNGEPRNHFSATKKKQMQVQYSNESKVDSFIQKYMIIMNCFKMMITQLYQLLKLLSHWMCSNVRIDLLQYVRHISQFQHFKSIILQFNHTDKRHGAKQINSLHIQSCLMNLSTGNHRFMSNIDINQCKQATTRLKQ